MRKMVLLTLTLWGLASAEKAPQASWTKDLKVLSGMSVSDQGELVFIGNDAKVYRIDSAGKVKWSYKLGDISRATPVITPQSQVIAASYDDFIYMLDQSGKLIWKTKLDGDIFASPLLRPDGSLVVATAGGTIFGLSAQGQILWRYSVGAPIFSSPVMATDGSIAFGAQNNRLYALNADGSLRWSFGAGSLIFSSPALDGAGNLYFGSSDRFVYSLTPEGKLRWKHQTGSFVNASPIVTSAGQVVVGSYDGTVYAFGQDGTPAWSYHGGAPFAAAASELSDGTLLVGDLQGTLHALRGGQALWKLPTGKKIDMNVAVSDQGNVYFATEGGALTALSKQAPLADAPWPSFRNTASAWGRVLTPAEYQARSNAKKAAGLAAANRVPPAPVAAKPAPITPPTPTPPQPVAAVVTPQQAAERLAQETRVVDGLIYLPLTSTLQASGLRAELLTPQSATLSLPRKITYAPQTVAVRYLAGQPYVALSELAKLPQSAFALAPTALNWTLAGESLTLPLNVPRLLPFGVQPEFPAVEF